MNLSLPSPELSIFGHIEELRRRIIVALLYFLVGTLIGFFFSKSIIIFLKVPADYLHLSFVFTKPTEVMSVYVKVAIYIGLIFAAPGIGYQLWQFVKPALGGRMVFLPWLAAGVALFVAGTIFSFTVLLPVAFRFLMDFSKDMAVPMISLNSYLSFVLSILAMGGAVFEMPLIAALLTFLRLVTPRFLKKKRREAIFIIAAIAAVLTPTTDIFNMLLFMTPMLLLYEISILVSALIVKKISSHPVEVIYANES